MRISKQAEIDLRDMIEASIDGLRTLREGLREDRERELVDSLINRTIEARTILNEEEAQGAAETIDRLSSLMLRMTPRAVLTSPTIDALRTVVLTERETDWLREAKMVCTNCGTTIGDGDNVTILSYRSDDGMRDSEVVCCNCSMPNRFTLKCGCQISLPATARKLIEKQIRSAASSHTCQDTERDTAEERIHRFIPPPQILDQPVGIAIPDWATLER